MAHRPANSLTDEAIIAEVERRMLGHKDDLSAGTRVVINFDEVIKAGTIGVVASDYIVNNRDSLRVRIKQSIWYLNRFQVTREGEKT